MNVTKKIVIVGSNSIHCKRYIAGMLATGRHSLVGIITNQLMPEFNQIPQLTVNFSVRNLQAARQIYKELLNLAPDVVHIHQANSYAWHTLRAISKLKPRPKVILTCWGSDVLILPNRNKLLHKMVVYNLHHADIITTDSLFMSTMVSKLMGRISRPIRTINFGIQELPPKANLYHKKKLILSNRLHKSLYRIDKIILAFAELVKHELIHQDYQLVVAAGGEMNSKLQALSRELHIESRVIFTGMIPYAELVELYRQSTIFVSVPESDGTASSLLEAMAYGCVPVVSCLPANLEWVIDRSNGFVVPNQNDLFADILAAIQFSENSQKYQQLVDFNYRLIEEKATAANNTRKFIELY